MMRLGMGMGLSNRASASGFDPASVPGAVARYSLSLSTLDVQSGRLAGISNVFGNAAYDTAQTDESLRPYHDTPSSDGYDAMHFTDRTHNLPITGASTTVRYGIAICRVGPETPSIYASQLLVHGLAGIAGAVGGGVHNTFNLGAENSAWINGVPVIDDVTTAAEAGFCVLEVADTLGVPFNGVTGGSFSHNMEIVDMAVYENVPTDEDRAALRTAFGVIGGIEL